MHAKHIYKRSGSVGPILMGVQCKR